MGLLRIDVFLGRDDGVYHGPEFFELLCLFFHILFSETCLTSLFEFGLVGFKVPLVVHDAVKVVAGNSDSEDAVGEDIHAGV